MPRQVLIEAVIAEITLSDGFELGLEWFYTKGVETDVGLLEGSLTGMRLSEALPKTLNETLNFGLYSVVGIADKVKAEISALASKKKVNILSRPHILASDNKEASINISKEIPVASSEFRYGSGSDVTETSIQYRDTGIMLSVTPHINERGLVTMEISQEVSEVIEKRNFDVREGDDKNRPSFFKRSVNTSLTVKHGQTIVIGGLIREIKDDSKSGSPWLVDIPVIRYLFGKTEKNTEKVELIILITPQVITSLEDVDAVTEEFKSKVGSVIKERGLGFTQK